MSRLLLAGAALALAAGVSAYAQPAPSSPPPAAAPSAAPAGVPATAASLKPGMVVHDKAGGTVGTINRVGKTAAGEDAVEVNIDGSPVGLPANILIVAQNGDVVSPVTKDQIKAAAAAQSGSSGATPPPATAPPAAPPGKSPT